MTLIVEKSLLPAFFLLYFLSSSIGGIYLCKRDENESLDVYFEVSVALFCLLKLLVKICGVLKVGLLCVLLY